MQLSAGYLGECCAIEEHGVSPCNGASQYGYRGFEGEGSGSKVKVFK